MTNMFRQTIDLSGEWKFAYSHNATEILTTESDIRSAGLDLLPATVPGNFELDLLRNGVIDEPYFGMNIVGLRKYEQTHVWYACTFQEVPQPGTLPYLKFEGLDCIAEIYLNGSLLAQTDNMLIEHEFCVDGLLRSTNEIVVHLKPVFEEAKKYDYPASASAWANNYESLYIRKAPHMYGWDIMPRALSAGIWRPVTLRYLPTEHLDRLFIETCSVAGDQSSAKIEVFYAAKIDARSTDDYELSIDGECGASRFSHKTRIFFGHGKCTFDVANPRLWWPRGRGEADIYNVTVRLLKNGIVIDEFQARTGIRTVVLERTSLTDADGNGEFCFWVNGQKIFALGTNWIPLDAYHSRDKQRIPAGIDLAVDIGCNMIRCWGGNVYEDNLFYDLCDEKGLLVWQDFAMACAIYPQDDHFCRRIEEEARNVVRRLRNHPCLVLWAGDNECDQFYVGGNTSRDPNANRLTRQVLPTVLTAEAVRVPYLPSSPYMDDIAYASGTDWDRTPENHLWGPRNYYKSEYYTEFNCHFASELGYHGLPSPETLTRFISPEKLWPYQNNDEWLLHCVSPYPGYNLFDYFIELMATEIRCLFGETPDNLIDYSFASQAVQAEAFKFFIETFRTQKWRRTGIIWWNLLDGWPEITASVVDYYYEKKLAFHYIKRSQSSLLVALREPQNGAQSIVAINDTPRNLWLEYSVSPQGKPPLAHGRVLAPADSAVEIGQIANDNSIQDFYEIRWSSDLGAAQNHYLAGTPPFTLEQYRTWITQAHLRDSDTKAT
jgi:beta-mannosidase